MSGCGPYPDGNPEALKVAQEYVKRMGLPRIRETCPVKVLPEACAELAAEYAKLKNDPKDPKVKQAYNALVREVKAQYDFIRKAGFTVEFTKEDPYPDSKAMMKDLCENRRLRVFSGSASHPFMTDRENVLFRAVHDFFGHAAHGHNFNQHGEENAWVEHSKMFTEKARAALTTETRGQNNWFNCAINPETGKPYNQKGNPQKTYAEQKAAVLPKRFWSRKDVAYKNACPVVPKAADTGRRTALANQE